MERVKNIDERLELFIQALDEVDILFMIFDEKQGLIHANSATKHSLPTFFEALESGSSLWEATFQAVSVRSPDEPFERLLRWTDRRMKMQLEGDSYEVTGRYGRIFAMTHHKLSPTTMLTFGINVSLQLKQKLDLQNMVDHTLGLANTDALTKLHNRRSFVEKLDTQISRFCKKERGFHLALIDLNGFKRVNDTYGHAVGDQLLESIGLRLSELTDDGDFAARLGGDEFAVFLGRQLNDEDLLRYGQAICDLLSEPHMIDQKRIRVSASIGWSTYPDNSETVSGLLRKSDHALYASKNKGGVCQTIFSAEHEGVLQRESAICYHLAVADLEQELFLEFQPIHDSANGSIRAFEALARWDSEALGRVHPDEFIPLAEQTGRISAITIILLRMALQTAKHWPRGINLHFNLSGVDLESHDFVLSLADIVKESGFPPNAMFFELTETAIIKNLDAIHKICEIFEQTGIRLSLDDFGKGYSSLTYLTRIPVSLIKIDKSFTERLVPGSPEESILEVMNQLCARLGLGCIIEGVEHAAQYNQLRKMGLATMQGYFFSAPLRAEELSAYVLDHMSAQLMPPELQQQPIGPSHVRAM